MYEEKILLLLLFSEALIVYIYNACKKEKYMTKITKKYKYKLKS